MGLGVDGPIKRFAVDGLVRYARSFYQLLGNRRKYERTPMSGNIFVTVAGCATQNTYACLCVNLSPRGIAIDSPEPLTVDSIVQLHSDEYGPRRMARVRHCTAGPSFYRIGLQFVAEQRQ